MPQTRAAFSFTPRPLLTAVHNSVPRIHIRQIIISEISMEDTMFFFFSLNVSLWCHGNLCGIFLCIIDYTHAHSWNVGLKWDGSCHYYLFVYMCGVGVTSRPCMCQPLLPCWAVPEASLMLSVCDSHLYRWASWVIPTLGEISSFHNFQLSDSKDI